MKRTNFILGLIILLISGFLSCTNNAKNKTKNNGSATTDSGIQNNQTTDTAKIDSTSTKGAVNNDTVRFGESQ